MIFDDIAAERLFIPDAPTTVDETQASPAVTEQPASDFDPDLMPPEDQHAHGGDGE